MKINYEFRKGIFFIRLIGKINNYNYQEEDKMIKEIILENKFKYIVLNTNYLKEIDLHGLNYILELCNLTKNINSNLVICDKTKIIKRLLSINIPNINEEIEIL